MADRCSPALPFFRVDSDWVKPPVHSIIRRRMREQLRICGEAVSMPLTMQELVDPGRVQGAGLSTASGRTTGPTRAAAAGRTTDSARTAASGRGRPRGAGRAAFEFQDLEQALKELGDGPDIFSEPSGPTWAGKYDGLEGDSSISLSALDEEIQYDGERYGDEFGSALLRPHGSDSPSGSEAEEGEESELETEEEDGDGSDLLDTEQSDGSEAFG